MVPLLSNKTLGVLVGENVTFRCQPDINQPPATIIWFIDDEMQQNSTATEFIVSVTLDLHNTHVYCKAYNLQPQNESVMSNIVLLNVEGKYECTQLLFRYNNN